MLGKIHQTATKALKIIIHIYRMMRTRRYPCCRYHPTCTQYALDALSVHGLIKGCVLIVWRVLRCNPFSKGGIDPVPPRKMWSNK